MLVLILMKCVACLTHSEYCCITGNFRGFQLSWISDLYHFVGLIFADMHDHATHYTIMLILC